MGLCQLVRRELKVVGDVVATGPSYDLERSEVGVTLVVTGPWTADAARVLRSGSANGLDLNYAKGFKNTDLAFLEDWPLREVSLLARTVKDLAPLERFAPTLERLSVQAAPTASIDLARFPRLTHLAAEWDQIRQSVLYASQLEDLFTLAYTEPDLTPLASNVKLRRFRAKDRPRLERLEGLASFPQLEHLGLYGASALNDIDALETSNHRLRQLHLEACRQLTHLSPVAACPNLEFLNASECRQLASVGPLAELHELENLWLYGTTEILDGNLSPIARLPRLRDLRLKSRRSYRPSVQQLQDEIARRQPPPP